jgi:hypothetical protein
MKTGNYQVANGGKVHAAYVVEGVRVSMAYLCGVGVYADWESDEDERTTKPVTCKNCLRVMAARKGKAK